MHAVQCTVVGAESILTDQESAYGGSCMLKFEDLFDGTGTGTDFKLTAAQILCVREVNKYSSVNFCNHLFSNVNIIAKGMSAR